MNPRQTNSATLPWASESGYREWRAARIDLYPRRPEDLLVQINGLANLDGQAKKAIVANCKRANMAIYNCRDKAADRAAVRAFAANFGLQRIDHHLCANDDGVSELTVVTGGLRGDYVPYSDHSLSWHTDGYYHQDSSRICAFVLHCVQDAAAGGDSSVLDPRIAYIRLRDENPAFIAAFEHPHCMTIPANNGPGGEIRPAVSGPVFWYGETADSLHMRYSARRKNIRWRDDPVTTAARHFLSTLLAADGNPVLRFSLGPGQGIISNNVLHNRTAFEDGPEKKRLLFRARFFDCIDSS